MSNESTRISPADTIPLSGPDQRLALTFGDASRLSLAGRAQFYKDRRQELCPPQLSEGQDPGDSIQAAYPYSKGLSLTNDGVAYGEALRECRIVSVKGKYTARSLESVRTRTGKVPTKFVDLDSARYR